MIYIVVNFYVRGRLALKIFPPLSPDSIIYSEKFASGYSTKSFKTRWGGASKVLHIIITENELWIKTFMFMAYIAKKHDLLHRIPLSEITHTEIKDGAVFSRLHISFNDANGIGKEIVLMSAHNAEITDLIEKHRLRATDSML
jgi:hypothetical protein